jgi:4-alpha-glucanotransferase
LQDVLGKGSEARMNVPATTSGNWAWRLLSDELTGAHAERLRRLCELYGRHPVMRAADRPEHTAESYEAKQTWG